MESKNTTPKQPTTYKVSEQTANFINLLDATSNLYSQITDAVIAMYGDEQATEIVERDFFPPLDAVRDIIGKHLVDSISDNIGCRQKQGII